MKITQTTSELLFYHVLLLTLNNFKRIWGVVPDSDCLFYLQSKLKNPLYAWTFTHDVDLLNLEIYTWLKENRSKFLVY